MRVLHRERQDELLRLAEPIGGEIELSASDGGLHLVARLPDKRDDRAVAKNALRRGVHVWPLSTHYLGAERQTALLLGYAGTTSRDMRIGIDVLTDILR
jgi:GntR family transcriptional regulator/MocR family aminotransferase